MTKQKNKTLILIIFIALMLITTASVSLAWFIDGVLSDKFKFTVAYIDSQVTVYRGEDDNHDGTLNVDSSGNPIFTELGDSNNGSIKLDSNGNPIYIGGKPVYDSGINIAFKAADIMPTCVYVWKVIVQNLGDVKARLFAEILVELDESTGKFGLDVMSVQINDTGKQFFAENNVIDATMQKKSQIISLIKGDELAYSEGVNTNPDSIKEYMICLEFETLEALNARGITITQRQYQAYAGRIISNAQMRVSLEDSRTTVDPT